MNKKWTPRLRMNEALAICGPLSSPSKMPCHGYGLPAHRCRIGSLLQLLPKTVCRSCYALRGRYLFPVVQAAMAKRFSSLTHPRWVEAVTTLIWESGDTYFRWHDSGDVQGLAHLRNIVRVCQNLPRVRFWLPTREYQTIEAYRRISGRIPKNLCIRYSANIMDGPPPIHYGLPVSSVHSSNISISPETYVCPAPQQHMRCGSCRACWDSSVKIVSYPVKLSRFEKRGEVSDGKS